MPFDADPAATHNPTLDDIVPVSWLDLINANFAAIGAAWTSFTPTWTGAGGNPAIGNGTLTGAYLQIGKTLHFRIAVTMGSTTTYGSGEWSFTLPNSLTSAGAKQIVPAAALDTGTAYRVGMGRVNASATAFFIASDGGGNGWSATVPHTWASGDTLQVNGTIEVA